MKKINWIMAALVILVYVVSMILGGVVTPYVAPVAGTALAPWVLPVVSGAIFFVIVYMLNARKHIEQ